MNSYGLISKYRRFLMGVAAIWLLLYHSMLTFSGRSFYEPFAFLFKTEGYTCVELFLLLSGFGLYRSLANSEAVLPFWRRRALRLLPSYYPIVMLWIVAMAFFGKITLPEAIGNLTCTGWLIDPASAQINWYPQVVWLFYLLAPPIAALIRNSGRPGLTTAALMGFSVLSAVPAFGDYRMLALSRLPVYILGFYLGRCAADGRDVRLPGRIVLYLLAAVGLGFDWFHWFLPGGITEDALIDCGAFHYTKLLAAPGLCLLFSRLAAYMDRCFLRGIVGAVSALGECSFEILLFQELVNGIYRGTEAPVTTPTALLAILLIIALALGYNRLLQRIKPRLFPAGISKEKQV